MKRFGIIVTTLLAMLAFVPAAQASSYCNIGDNGITTNLSGTDAKFKSLYAMGKMNCASARYVLNKKLRRSFAKHYSNTIVTNFFDGYVTWYCDKLTRLRWQCDEYDSNTSFRFTAYTY